MPFGQGWIQINQNAHYQVLIEREGNFIGIFLFLISDNYLIFSASFPSPESM
jgi:hypothetical protein